MRRRRKEDYVAVLNALRNEMRNCHVKSVMTDFEAAIWSAVADVFPGVKHSGCCFHWKQAVLRMVGVYNKFACLLARKNNYFYNIFQTKKLGLGADYLKKKSEIRDSIELILCLPIVPASKIVDVFNHIRSKAPDAPALDRLFKYVDQTWMSGRWNPDQWSVFEMAIRTNNDCEGLHNRWNLKGKNRKGYYWILSILVEETNRIARTSKQLQYGCKVRERNAVAKRKEEQLFRLWDQYRKGELSSFDLVNQARGFLKRNFPSFALCGLDDEHDESDYSSYPL